MSGRRVVHLTCTECGFETRVSPDDAESPHEIIIHHGTETGHKVSITREE